jgi:hypothetical protein
MRGNRQRAVPTYLRSQEESFGKCKTEASGCIPITSCDNSLLLVDYSSSERWSTVRRLGGCQQICPSQQHEVGIRVVRQRSEPTRTELVTRRPRLLSPAGEEVTPKDTWSALSRYSVDDSEEAKEHTEFPPRYKVVLACMLAFVVCNMVCPIHPAFMHSFAYRPAHETRCVVYKGYICRRTYKLSVHNKVECNVPEGRMYSAVSGLYVRALAPRGQSSS